MLKREREQRQAIEMLCVDMLVPKDHLLRKIDAAVDFTRIIWWKICTSASILIESGASITTVSQRLGHSQISTTLDVYSHQIKKRDAAGMAAKMTKKKPLDAYQAVSVLADPKGFEPLTFWSVDRQNPHF